jgi:Na+-driven multidrug efflux pump
MIAPPRFQALNNVLRATGRMREPGLINLVSFYAVGLPLAYYVTFVRSDLQLGLFGLCALMC